MKVDKDNQKYKGTEIHKDTPKELAELVLSKRIKYPFHIYAFLCLLLAIGCYFLPIEQETINLSFMQVGKVTGSISACLVLVAGFLFYLHYSQTVIKTTK